jgi:hypothetical protein
MTLLPALAGTRVVGHALVIALVLLGGSGCSKGKGRRPVVAVRGQAFARFQGKVQPAQGAQLLFYLQNDQGDPLPMVPGARVADDGSFQPSTYTAKDGLPIGDYKVTATWQAMEVHMGRQRPAGQDRLQGKYKDPKSTPLRARVTSSGLEPQRFDLD